MFYGAGVPDDHHDFDPTRNIHRKTTDGQWRRVEAGRDYLLRRYCWDGKQKEDERYSVIDELLEGSKSGNLAHGGNFGCSTKQVSVVWRQYKSQKDAGIAAPSLRSRRAGNSGRKDGDLEELCEKLKQIPMNRTTLRSVAAQLGLPRSTLASNLKKMGLRFSPHLHKQTAERCGTLIGMAFPVSAEALAAAQMA